MTQKGSLPPPPATLGTHTLPMRFQISRLLSGSVQEISSPCFIWRGHVHTRAGAHMQIHSHNYLSTLRIALQSAGRSVAYIPYPAQNRGRISAPERALLTYFLRRLSWLGGEWLEPPLPAPYKGNLLICRGGADCSHSWLPLQLPLCSIDERRDLHSDWVTLTHSVW